MVETIRLWHERARPSSSMSEMFVKYKYVVEYDKYPAFIIVIFVKSEIGRQREREMWKCLPELRIKFNFHQSKSGFMPKSFIYTWEKKWIETHNNINRQSEQQREREYVYVLKFVEQIFVQNIPSMKDINTRIPLYIFFVEARNNIFVIFIVHTHAEWMDESIATESTMKNICAAYFRRTLIQKKNRFPLEPEKLS